ncbi:hypothetical protein [Amycolatopsis eburnea]|uniref:Uncharacterized protein n=1 Tax=Amycolatopsis eburnea TaxID=2267691 RepID=A0A3R9F5K8_9PSEU|nr:hypothetical protein [Amycolatopsis eburnea]RSD16425.1 hypothetical protein EIY87_22545 [Amycolatopsis eburnea]
MKRIAAAAALGLACATLPVVAGPAAASESVTCGNYATQGSAGPNARDYYWGNCGSTATKINVYALAYGGGIKTFYGEKCVAAGTAALLGRTTQYLVSSYTGEDTGTAC